MSSKPFFAGVRMRRLYFESVTQRSSAAVAVDVGKYRAHGRSVLAVLSVGDAEIGGDFFEGAVVLVVEEEVFGLVVGDVDVGIAVAVEVGSRHAHGAAFVGADARTCRSRR